MFKTKKTRSESEDGARSFTSSDVSRIAQVSLRQLQWWDERKVVSPRHEGHKRVYQPAEVIEITVIAELRRKGFSLQKIRRVLRFLQREMGKRLSDVVAVLVRFPPGYGRQFHFPRRPTGADHRHPEERQAAHVPGLRERSGAAPQ
jgi:DNA-binding transcriptional MerR regulator